MNYLIGTFSKPIEICPVIITETLIQVVFIFSPFPKLNSFMLKGKQSFEYPQLLIVRLIRKDLDVATYFSPTQVSRYPSGLTMVRTYQSYSLLRRLYCGVSETSFYTTQSMIPEDK